MTEPFADTPKHHEIKSLWIHKGVNVGKDGMVHCPHCNRILLEGEYSRKPQKIICPSCKKESTFERLT